MNLKRSFSFRVIPQSLQFVWEQSMFTVVVGGRWWASVWVAACAPSVVPASAPGVILSSGSSRTGRPLAHQAWKPPRVLSWEWWARWAVDTAGNLSIQYSLEQLNVDYHKYIHAMTYPLLSHNMSSNFGALRTTNWSKLLSSGLQLWRKVFSFNSCFFRATTFELILCLLTGKSRSMRSLMVIKAQL